jgi:excinuclease ABC subunit C
MSEKSPFREDLLLTVRNLPEQPGVYLYSDSQGKVIYVGKAKNLRKRVSSYFLRTNLPDAKTRVLVRNIHEINYFLVDTELDALLLENNLIKQHQPRYNVNLKDDKTYPWICIRKEPFPRVFSTRKRIPDGSQYFGPFPSGKMMFTVLELIRKLFPLRTCNLPLTAASIEKGKYRVCLEYHIGNCLGPCEAKQSAADYDQQILQIKQIIKGHTASIIRDLKKEMEDMAAALRFEKAQHIKERIEILESYQGKSAVVSPVIDEVDVLSLAFLNEHDAAANYFKVVQGSIVMGQSIELKRKLNEPPEELLSLAFTEFRLKFESQAKEIIVPFLPGFEIPGITFFVPQKGDKKRLLDLSEQNALAFLKEKQKQQELVDPERHSKRILSQMMKDLRMTEEPRHIECFDNSNFQGDFAVAAMTVFKDAKPSKKDYRHFNIKTVVGPDDFASMEEIIYRRYKRVIDEGLPLPQLIVIDGGKGQLSAAMKSLAQLNLVGKMTVIGIAKRLEEIYFPGDSIPLYIDKKSETLKIIQHIRDEAHRFGITHHRKKRDKETLNSELLQISGVGEALAEKLLRAFRSVKGVKEASLDELKNVCGESRAKKIFDFFRFQENQAL